MADEGTQNQSSWAYRQEEGSRTDDPQPKTTSSNQEPITWTASEFIARQKNFGWFLTLFAGTIIFSAIVYLTTRDAISVFFIAIVSVLFALLSNKKPRQLAYRIDSQGVTTGEKFYPFSEIKSFSVLREGAVGFINLMPLKRFLPEISIYYALEDEQRIVDALANSVPYEQRDEHGFDRLMKKLHF